MRFEILGFNCFEWRKMEVRDSSNDVKQLLYLRATAPKNGRIRWTSDVAMTDPNETTTHNHPNDESERE